MISNAYNARHQSEIHTQYIEVVEQVDTYELEAAWEQAELYNRSIVPGTYFSESYSQEAILFASEEYEQLLNLSSDGIMGYIEIPLIDVSLPIYHGTDSDTLDAGIGHLIGSSLPVGGSSTHCVLTGHSGMANQKLFSDLDNLQIGDIFYLQVLDKTLAYQVDQIETVLPYDSSYLGITEGEDYCTLVTCTPFGVNTHRLLVRGARIEYEEAETIVEDQTQDTDLPTSTWEQQYIMGIIIGIGTVFVLALVLFCLNFRRRDKYEE